MSLKLLSLFAVLITLFNVGESGRLPVRMNTTVTNVVCPDQGQCPDGDTCCELEAGDYGCCPLSDAVCCPDKETCCPHGTTCNGGSCLSVQKQLTKPILKKLDNFSKSNSANALKNVQHLAQVVSSGVNDICPPFVPCISKICCQGFCCPYIMGFCCTGITCCQYGWVCCQYGFHCCPPGMKCRSTGGCEVGDEARKNSLLFIQSILSPNKDKK